MTDSIQWGTLWVASSDDAVVQFDHAGSRIAEATPLVGGKRARVSDRGNATSQFVIGVLREHAGVAAARAFILEHAQTIQNLLQTEERSLVMGYSADGTASYSLSRAVLGSYNAKQKGVSTLHNYTFTGEEIS